MANFDIELNDEVENFAVEFGEIQRITVDDFDKLRNRPSYAGQTMTHETNIPAVPSKVSQLENDSDYQTGADVAEAIAGKQDTLTAGSNIQISEQNVISATDTTYSAGSGINISNQNAISVDTTVVATQQGLADEVTNRENADIYLQGQIDAISASSDVVDIVGTYADLQNYDTTKLKDNDIIKVLQDETQGNATTYYRWSTHTNTFTLIGQEGPYYTKAGADAQFVPQTRTVNGKALSSNITLNASDVSALGTSDVSQTTGSSTSMVMSQKATTDALGTKLNITDYVVDTQLADSDNPVQNRVLNGLLGDMPSDFFSGEATTSPTANTSLEFGNILNLDDVQLLGDTTQATTTGKNKAKTTDCNLSGTNYTLTIDNGLIELHSTTSNGSFDLCGGIRTGVWLPSYSGANDYHLTPTGGEYSLSVHDFTNSSTGAGNMNLSLFTNKRAISRGITSSATSVQSFSITLDDDEYVTSIYVWTPSSSTFNVTMKLQLEAGSTATSYEPYTGGIPAPNPDYPETVNVVSGVQTVTVSDGGSNTQTYTIDLGATELCKIGTYQDKIYKSGGDWYVHKEFGKYTFDGSETITYNSSNHGFTINPTNLPNYFPNIADPPMIGLSTHFKVNNTTSTWTSDNTIGLSSAGVFWCKAISFATSLQDCTTWLTNNTPTVYYTLATSTDTKITDATLISELEAVLNASTYDGETDIEITATGTNLPAPLQITAVNANAKGIIERLRA